MVLIESAKGDGLVCGAVLRGRIFLGGQIGAKKKRYGYYREP
jgi:hypothetical protein